MAEGARPINPGKIKCVSRKEELGVFDAAEAFGLPSEQRWWCSHLTQQ